MAGFFFFSPANIVAATYLKCTHHATRILLLSNSALVVARLALVVVCLAHVVARLALLVVRLVCFAARWTAVLARLADNTLSSSLREWSAHITITHGVTYRGLEACCLSTLEALLPVW